MIDNINPLALNGNRYLITGAASGIGKSVSILLSRLGAKLILVDLNSEGLLKTREACSATDRILTLDLVNPALIKKAVNDIIVDFGKLNGFVHLAGKPYIAPLKAISQEKTLEIYTLNTYAAIELAKVFTGKDVFAGEKGSIVFVSSVYALVGSAANVGYAMSKAALHGITKSLAIELAPRKIRVNCVAPGFIKTKMQEGIKDKFDESYTGLLESMHPLGMGDAEDVANSVAFLLSDAAKWITGTVLTVDGGFTAQ